MAGYFNNTTPSLFTSNMGKLLFILLLANYPSSPPSYIIFCHILIYLFSSPSLTLVSLLAHLSSPFTSACSLLICLPVFTVTPCVTKFKSLSAAHSLILSRSLHPLQSYPFTVRAVPQADTEITV